MRSLSLGITLCLYLLYFSGLFLAESDILAYIMGWITLRRRLPVSKNISRNSIEKKISSFVYMATGKEGMGRKLIYVCAFIFLFSFLYLITLFNIFFSLIIALLVASVPVLSLVSKIQNQRSRSSKEGLAFAAELQRNYVIENKNIYEALEKTSAKKEAFPACGKQAYLLLLKLRSSEGILEEKDACRDFGNALGSLWGKSLALAIASACSGYDVSDAFDDIVSRLKRAETRLEERKRLNGEAIRMSLILVPFMYILSLLISVRYLGISLGNLLRNQFGTVIGLKLFSIILLLFVFNGLILSYVTKKPADI